MIEIEEWLKLSLGKNWFDSNTCKILSKCVRQESVQVHAGYYQVGDLSSNRTYLAKLPSFRMGRHPITNDVFVSFLNSLETLNEKDGTFRWINTQKIDSKIRRSGCRYYKEKDGAFRCVRTDHKDIMYRYYVVPSYEKHHVTGVNWIGALFFARAFRARLPTEAEWEVVAKAGNDDALYHWGNDPPSPERTNYGEFVGSTSEVGRYPPNPLGVYDLCGNIGEWCMDWYHPDLPYPINRDIDIVDEMQVSKVIKGGG